MIPPALPIYFSICKSLALKRLRGLGIFGLDTEKTLVAGKVQTMCFDKTGIVFKLYYIINGIFFLTLLIFNDKIKSFIIFIIFRVLLFSFLACIKVSNIYFYSNIDILFKE
jgi:hypothetical protein